MPNDKKIWVGLPGLWSAVGERRKWSGGGETAGTQTERNAAAEPQTEARRICGQSIAARDERAVCEVERAARGPKQTVRWSRRFGISKLETWTADVLPRGQ